jgi:periplasmic divalent cation tolerance protein
MLTGMRVLLCTCPVDGAPTLLRALLEEHLVGCGNIVAPVRSSYWWDGAIQDDAEALLVMETAADRVAAAMARIAQLHPYAVPKIIAVDPSAVHEPYLAWLVEVTRPSR